MPTEPPAGAIRITPDMNIEAASTAGGAGATFWLEPGEYREQSVTPLAGQTFIGAEGATLNGSRLLTAFTREGDDWVASGQTQDGLRRATSEGYSGFARAGYPDAFYINDEPLTPVGSRSDLAPGKFFLDYDSDKIYFRDDPNGKAVEAATQAYAFGGDASNVTIENLVVEQYAAPVQYGAIGGNAMHDGWTVRDNEVRLNYGVGIATGDNSEVLNNFVHDNGQMGLGSNGNNILVEGNEIARNGYWSGIDVFWEGGGSKWGAVDGLVVRNNYSHHNQGNGLWTDVGSINVLYEGNRLEYNTAAGISHEVSYAATIRDNTFVGNGTGFNVWLWGSGIQIQNSQDVEIHDNVVDAREGNGITLVQQDRGTDALTQNNNVHHNTIISGGLGGDQETLTGLVADWNEAQVVRQNNRFDYNEYRFPSSTDDFWFWGEAYGWDTYRQVSGQDQNSTLALI